MIDSKDIASASGSVFLRGPQIAREVGALTRTLNLEILEEKISELRSSLYPESTCPAIFALNDIKQLNSRKGLQMKKSTEATKKRPSLNELLYGLNSIVSRFKRHERGNSDDNRNVLAAISALTDRSKKHDQTGVVVEKMQEFTAKQIEELSAKIQQVLEGHASLSQFLSPELQKKVLEMHNIEGDILTFNDRLQAMQGEMQTQEQLSEKQTELKKMVRRVNQSHGDAFKRIAALEESLERVKESGATFRDATDERIKSAHKRLVALESNPYLFLTSFFTSEKFLWILLGALAVGNVWLFFGGAHGG